MVLHTVTICQSKPHLSENSVNCYYLWDGQSLILQIC